MSLRQLSDLEKQRMRRLTAESIEFALIQPTRTALGKGYMDATLPVRSFLAGKRLHEYEFQGRGARENGVRIDACIVSDANKVDAMASLYKPKAKPTKDGDPRIWFSCLHQHVSPDDMLALIEHEGCIVVVNLTDVDVINVLDVRRAGPLWEILADVGAAASSVAIELLQKLRFIAADGLIPSVMEQRADTSIGRTLEAKLGIQMNARREPDYKGIELKSHRKKPKSRENRKQLFTKVPNWEISRLKSNDEILAAFGYFRNGRDRLNCTVSAANVNSQGLTFSIDENAGILNEVSTRTKHHAFASWYLSDLRAIIRQKHAETFWVGAKAHIINGREHFEFVDVVHTRKPVVSQFDVLVQQGDITMDHLMKRLDSGAAREGGPSFKINPKSMELLFPPSRNYTLLGPGKE